MKTFRSIGMGLLAVLMCVNFAACSSDDNDPTEEPEEGEVVVSGKKIAKVVTQSDNWKETLTYSYDDKGRLIEATETDENNGAKDTDIYQFVWGDDAIKFGVKGSSLSETLSLKNGLVQDYDNETFTYNNSNRLVRVEDKYETTIVIWDGDKLVSISNENEDVTITYDKSCKSGYVPFIAQLIGFSYDHLLFTVHPEIIGTRTTKLPASITETDRNGTETLTCTYEFDKDGYVSKMIMKEAGGSTRTSTITWQ